MVVFTVLTGLSILPRVRQNTADVGGQAVGGGQERGIAHDLAPEGNLALPHAVEVLDELITWPKIKHIITGGMGGQDVKV